MKPTCKVGRETQRSQYSMDFPTTLWTSDNAGDNHEEHMRHPWELHGRIQEKHRSRKVMEAARTMKEPSQHP